MREKLHDNIHVVICTGLVLVTMFVFFAVIYPSVPFDADDWHYLSKFPGSPIPIPPFRAWNPTRIFPEHMMPIAGYFSAFVVYPLTGDYILSITITTALLLCVFLSILYLSLYRLFLTLNKDKSACAIAGLFAIALCFALFLSKPSGNLHLFIVYSLNLHYFYTLPNVLNSIVVCELMRIFIRGNLSFRNIPRKMPLMIALLYFCIFSMLFSTLVLLAFAASVIVYKLLDSLFRQKGRFLTRLGHFGSSSLKRMNIAIIAIIGIVFAIIAESLGGRANWDSGSTFFESVFSVAFVSRMYTAARSLLSFLLTMNTLVLVMLALILFSAAGAWIYRICRKKTPASPFAKAIPVSLLCCIAAFLLIVLVSAKGGLQYAKDIRSSYSVFFFGILLVSLAALYLHGKVPLARMLFPLMTVFVVLIAVNTRWPYAYTYERTQTQTVFIESCIEQVVKADINNEPVVELKVPKYNDYENWPIPVDWWGDALSDTLYNHHVISGKIKIVLVPDDSLPTP